MLPFETLADPVRRRIVEALTEGEYPASDLTRLIRDEFAISQPAVSQHLRVLRERGFVTTRAEGTRRHYRLTRDPFADVRQWLARYDALWSRALDDLDDWLTRDRPDAAAREDTDDDAPR
jgi:DNA-binding transcriptional ArsR family regulator